jgi:hypothetical protein
MVRSKVLAFLAMGGVAFVMVAGCTSGSTGSAVPSSGSSSSPATSTAPKSEIADPLSVDKLAGDICSGFTDAQLAPYLGELDGKDASTVGNGPLCTFRPKAPLGPTVGGAVANISAPTQEALYESQRGFAWRQKISPIAGYPAVDASLAGNPTDPAQGGDCSTDVAVNDKQYIGVDFSVTNKSDPNFAKACTISEALAALLVQNIKSGGA